jgi:hypothetical protein
MGTLIPISTLQATGAHGHTYTHQYAAGLRRLWAHLYPSVRCRPAAPTGTLIPISALQACSTHRHTHTHQYAAGHRRPRAHSYPLVRCRPAAPTGTLIPISALQARKKLYMALFNSNRCKGSLPRANMHMKDRAIVLEAVGPHP